MNDFQQLWALLRQHGSSAKRETECAALWATYPPDLQQRIYATIRTKLEQGKFVHYDPVRALEENARPPCHRGDRHQAPCGSRRQAETLRDLQRGICLPQNAVATGSERRRNGGGTEASAI